MLEQRIERENRERARCAANPGSANCPDYVGLAGLFLAYSGGCYIYEGLINEIIGGGLGPSISTGVGLCTIADCSKTIDLSSKIGQNVWRMNTFDRGWAIERELGRSPWLYDAYPTIDRFENGVVTSIKSLDLGARSYQNINALTSEVIGYVDKLTKFTGYPKGQYPIYQHEIIGRELLLVIPSNANVFQVDALSQLEVKAAQMGVNLVIQIVK